MLAKIQELNQRLRHGVIPAMATPLEEDGYRVRRPVVKQLVDFLIAAGVSGLFVGGTTGEGVLLEPEQRMTLHELALEAVAGRVPALVHVGANTTAGAVELARHAALLGADALAAVTPFFYPVHEDALLGYYQSIAAVAPDIPFYAYDIPHQAINGVSPALLVRLAQTLPNLAGVKCSRPDSQFIRELIDRKPAGTAVYVGNERIALALLALGADGLVNGISTAVPEVSVAMTRAFAAGDMAEAQRQQRLMNRIGDILPAGARIGAFKVILAQRGIAAGPAVPPRPTPTGWSGWAQIKDMLEL